ncbi:MAG: radical SAM protein [archaeon]
MHPALHWKKLPNQKIQCRLCAHYCLIKEGEFGFCRVRKNSGGALVSLSYGLARGVAIDPIEKKPFFQFFPGSRVLSFGTPGCNFTCLGCQNWDLSQEPRLGVSEATEGPLQRKSRSLQPEELVKLATGTDGLAYTYSEPTIFWEYALDCIRLSRKLGKRTAESSRGWTRSRAARGEGKQLYNVFVSNGFFSRELANQIIKEKLLDAVRIDLKFMDEKNYKNYCGGRLKPVLDNIRKFAKSEIHLEVMVLIIPDLNDSPATLRKFAKFIASVDKSIPIHFLRFFPQYKAENRPTPDETLVLAGKIAKKEGLEYVYLGNSTIPGGEDTLCPGCGKTLVRREGFGVVENFLRAPACPFCERKLRRFVLSTKK